MFKVIIALLFLIQSFPVFALDFGAVQAPRLMATGDSITRGTGDGATKFGYRDHLQTDLGGVGVYTFTGPYLSPNSDGTFQVRHNGYVGKTAATMASSIASELAYSMPKPNPKGSIVVLHAGTNDINAVIPNATIVASVQSIIDATLSYDPSITVYVMLLIPSTTGGTNTTIDAFNLLLLAQLQSDRLTRPNQIHYIDMNTAFKTCASGVWATCMNDALHPNDTGYIVMSTTIASCILNNAATYCDNN